MVLIIPKQFRASFQLLCNQIIWKSDVWGSLTELNSVYFKAASLPPVFPITATTGELSSSVTEFAKGLISHILQPLLVAHFLRQVLQECAITCLHSITGSLGMLVFLLLHQEAGFLM